MSTRSISAAVGSLLVICLFAASAPSQIILRRANSPVGVISLPATKPGLPTLPMDLYLRADALRKEGKNDEALATINEALRRDPDCGKCYGLRSGVLGNLQKYKEGLADGHIGILRSTTPRHKAMSAYNKGFSLGGLGRNSEALEAYNDSIGFDPTFGMAHFGKGKTLYFMWMYAESKVALEKALEINPQNGPAWAYLAEDQMNLGDVRAGIASAHQAVELAPSDARSFRARTIARYWEHNYDAMLADATRTLEIDPDRPHAHLLRGHALKLLGRNDESAAEYALEADRKAVQAGMFPRHVDLRIYNCGDDSTELQTASNFNIDGFTNCAKRVMEGLDETIRQLEAKPTPKRSVPGLPAKRATKK